MATFNDSFNRADEAQLGSPWSSFNGNGLSIISNEVGTTGTTDAASIVSGEVFLDDQSAEITFTTIDAAIRAGVLVRCDGSGNGYGLDYWAFDPSLRLGRYTNGSFSSISNLGAITLSEGDRIKLSVTGDTFTVYVNGVQFGSNPTDNVYTSGSPGIKASANSTNNGFRLDNFVAEGAASAATIDSVDGDGLIEDGQQNIPFTVSGFSGDITSASLTAGAYTTPLAGLTGAGENYTFDLFDVSGFSSDAAGIPFTSANHVNTFEASDGTDTATLEITRNPKDGWAVVDTANAVATQGSVFENRVGGAMADTSQVLYPTSNNTTVAPDGTITTDANTVEGKAWDVDTGTWETFTVNFGSADTTKPVITLLGDASVTITEGDTYTDAGATAVDDTDGDITADIVTVNPVDTNTVGTYTVTYNVSDAAGNAADEVTRTVIVEAANVAPTANAGVDQSVAAGAAVTLDGTGSTDGDGTIVSYAWSQSAGDAVTLTGATTATPSFTAPSTNATQTLTFDLTVTDNEAATATDSVDVDVAAEIVQQVESTLTVSYTGMQNKAYDTVVVDTDNDEILFNQSSVWTNGSHSFTFTGTPTGTNVKVMADDGTFGVLQNEVTQ